MILDATELSQPTAVATALKCLMKVGFRLRSVHPPYTAEDIRANTGFDYEVPARVPPTPQPDTATLALLRGKILDELSESYPSFAKSMLEAA